MTPAGERARNRWIERVRGVRRHNAALSLRRHEPGDRVVYIGKSMFDMIIENGEVGVVTDTVNGWVFARWSRAGEVGVLPRLLRSAGTPAAPDHG